MSATNEKSARSEVHGQNSFPAATSLVGVYGEQLFRILEQTSSGYVLLDAQNRAQRWNDGYLQLFPWLAATLKVGIPLQAALQAAATAAPASAAPALSHIAGSHQALIARQQVNAQFQLPDGRKLNLSAHALSANYTVLACKELLPHGNEAESLSFFDVLTNLPNRRLLLDRLSQAMIQSERTGWRGALLTIDMGPVAGSSAGTGESPPGLAQNIAQRLLACVRSCDTVARLDAKRFVIMVSDLSPDIEVTTVLVERLGERLQESLNGSYQLGNKRAMLEANIGATLFGPHSRSATELLQQAESAMYRLRDEEARGLHFFSPEQRILADDRHRMEQELREALRLGQFELHYQAQYSASGDVNGLEALLRWRHPRRGLVPPSIFLSVAEETDIIVPLGRWSIQAACEQLARWKAEQQLGRLPICVNISARQLRQADLAEQVQGIISQTGVDPALLLLELSTQALSPSYADIVPTLTRLRTMGVRLSLDDFGGGSNMLEALQQLPLNQLKLSHSLVQRLGPNNAAEAAVQAAIALAARHRMTIVGVGVETLEQRALLAQYGCEHFMGYLLSPPAPVGQLRSLLQRQAISSLQEAAA
ncbi:putative bifunctional diguanylate cyclase/phosphodiesterase [Comamonas testosteroni]|uniref:Cyclic di-GMP phosphodiesterase Gmr n=1 Tax=Comamonas testosteroni TaxID=285 RepID=A0A8B4S232_COMTE|nr:GGDEF and EAL domain-containing protein [Comamonas testosteroni]EHN65470.1 diguanylate cyclase/phosphodiesterase [Comamonas testosteroni ATCC 11996]QQN70164.1 GGDEF and EAL domain-containing protein [Comamonas testosteroni]SUY75623.1 Cyclic di-GMP phosphodiesterase Gmr [Comamonas testosteroni]